MDEVDSTGVKNEEPDAVLWGRRAHLVCCSCHFEMHLLFNVDGLWREYRRRDEERGARRRGEGANLIRTHAEVPAHRPELARERVHAVAAESCTQRTAGFLRGRVEGHEG